MENVIKRSDGISKTIFILSLVIVAGVSGVSGYFVAGFLKPGGTHRPLTHKNDLRLE